MYISSTLLLIVGFFLLIIALCFFKTAREKSTKNLFCFIAPVICYYGISIFCVIHCFNVYYTDKKYGLLYGNGFFMAIGGLVLVVIFCFMFFKNFDEINDFVEIGKFDQNSITEYIKQKDGVKNDYVELDEEKKNGNTFD